MEPLTTIKGCSKDKKIMSSLAYRVSKASQSIVKLHVCENLLVEKLVNTSIKDGAHRYEFSQEDTGCRAWVSQHLGLLLSKGVITSNEEVEEAKKALNIQAPKGYTYEMDYRSNY